jgi:hypothetical protein
MATPAAAGTAVTIRPRSFSRGRADLDAAISGKPSGRSRPACARTASRLGLRSGSSSIRAEPCQTVGGKPARGGSPGDPADLGIPILASSARAGSALRHSWRASARSHGPSCPRSFRCPINAVAIISVVWVAPTAWSGSPSSPVQYSNRSAACDSKMAASVARWPACKSRPGPKMPRSGCPLSVMPPCPYLPRIVCLLPGRSQTKR